jgi:hypothetical protein
VPVLGARTAPQVKPPTPPARILTVPVLDIYDAAQVTLAGGVVTVPSGLATYKVATGTLEVNSRFTVTLPTGFSFSSQPALSVPSPTQLVLQSGGIGAQSATFTVTGAALSGGQSLTLTGFAVQGATALETPMPITSDLTPLPITMQATNNSQIDNNDATPLSAPAFASLTGALGLFSGTTSSSIDLSSPTLGTLFWDAISGSDTATIALGELAIVPESAFFFQDPGEAFLNPDGSPQALATADTATVTVSGLFDGIASAFAVVIDSASFDIDLTAACSSATTIPATVTPSSITVAGVPIDTDFSFEDVVTNVVVICATAGGTSLLPENPNGFGFTYAPSSTSTDFLGGALFGATPGFIDYTGGGVIGVTNFFTGDDSGYASLLRVNNAGTAPSNLFALVQPDTGGATLTGSLGSIGAGQGTVFTEAQLAAAVSGLDLANSGQRATLQLIVTGDSFPLVKASSLLVNPAGVVDNVGISSTTGRSPG